MASLGDVRLLVVDDNERMRELLRHLLRAAGISNVLEAAGSHEAMMVLRLRGADLVLVDWKMTPDDGLSLTRRLRLDPDSPNPFIPIVMLTAHTEASRVAAARDAGVSGFLRKPISTRMLFDRVASALTDDRMFVRSESFFGPDRRRGEAAGYAGPFRRGDDVAAGFDTIEIDDMRLSA